MVILFAWDCVEKYDEVGRGGACVPARVALRGRIRRSFLRIMHVFLVWKRRYADVRAGTQAPPLHGFVWVDCAWTVDAVWVDCVWTVGFVWVDCVCGFVCWENGAHEPTPPVLYFCQPRVD